MNNLNESANPSPNDQPYFIAGAQDLNNLGLQCISLCEAGWQPVGGPGFVPPGAGTLNDGYFFQAFHSPVYRVAPVTAVTFSDDEFPDEIG